MTAVVPSLPRRAFTEENDAAMVTDLRRCATPLSVVAAFLGLAAAATTACSPADAPLPKAAPAPTAADSFGALPSDARTIRVDGRRELVESSAAASSVR